MVVRNTPPLLRPLRCSRSSVAAFHADYGLVADIVFGVGELARELIVEVGAVGNQDDGGAGKVLAFHQQPSEEEHGVAFAAAGCAEIGAAFAVAASAIGLLTVFQNVLVELSGGIKLGIAANDLFVFARDIGEEDKMPNHLPQPIGVKHSLD